MGLILDSSVLITAEREGRTVGELLVAAMGDQEAALSSIARVDLHLGYAVVTGNPRHFQMIPGLSVRTT